MTETLLLTSTPVYTYQGQQSLTNASGFFFERDQRIYLVTSRHVLIDKASGHYPDRIEIELHANVEDLARVTRVSILLYENGRSSWRDGLDASGTIDVAVIELDKAVLPDPASFRAFSPAHLLAPEDSIEIGTPLLVVGFPMGFHDSLHHLPVVRQAVVASSFGFRFKGQGYFLTDARTHRGISGAPVVAKCAEPDQQGDLPWLLLGVHSARLDAVARDITLDEALGLNCAWYADILMTLTQP
jgi:S1-C subfamily serine protease